jgi:hypothetical protein
MVTFDDEEQLIPLAVVDGPLPSRAMKLVMETLLLVLMYKPAKVYRPMLL